MEKRQKHRTSTENTKNLKADSLSTTEHVYPSCADKRLATSKPLLPFKLCVLSN